MAQDKNDSFEENAKNYFILKHGPFLFSLATYVTWPTFTCEKNSIYFFASNLEKSMGKFGPSNIVHSCTNKISFGDKGACSRKTKIRGKPKLSYISLMTINQPIYKNNT